MNGASLSEHPACAYLNPISSYDMMSMIGASRNENPACPYLNPVSSYDMEEYDWD